MPRTTFCLGAASSLTVLMAAPATLGFHSPISTPRNHEPSCLFNQNCNTAVCTVPRRRSARASRLLPTSSIAARISSRDRSENKGLKALGPEGGNDGPVFYTPADLDAYSALWGITLHYTGTLNTYRIEAHRPNGEVAGYTTGFYVGDYLHLDKVQIQRKESAYEPGAPNAPLPGTRTLPWAEKSDNLFQLGAVLGCAAVRYGYDRGARKVELLAIRENEKQHSRLVRYYRIAGFRAIREVGEDLGSLKDRLLWGAEGTLMAAKVEDFMERWTRVLLKDSNSDSDSSAREAVGASAESLTSS